MKIVIPSSEDKLCGHFGHCEYFSVVNVNPKTREILSIEKIVPEDGISCGSANWIVEQGADLVLAGGMGGRPMNILTQNGVELVAGCPEMPIQDLVVAYLAASLETGENACGGEHHHCHGHSHGEGEHHHCHGHH